MTSRSFSRSTGSGLRLGAGSVSAKRSGRDCWYETDIYVCVLCCHEQRYRERMYTPRPEKWEDRNHVFDTACPDHFL